MGTALQQWFPARITPDSLGVQGPLVPGRGVVLD